MEMRLKSCFFIYSPMINQISSHSHIWSSVACPPQVLYGSEKSFLFDHEMKQSRRREVRAIPQNDAGMIRKVVYDRSYPVRTGYAINVRKGQPFMLTRSDPGDQSIFFAGSFFVMNDIFEF